MARSPKKAAPGKVGLKEEERKIFQPRLHASIMEAAYDEFPRSGRLDVLIPALEHEVRIARMAYLLCHGRDFEGADE